MQASAFKLKIDALINQRHLLNHPFYQAWSAGELTQEHLAHYAGQYFHHVLAEPTYLSAVHANTPDFDGDISIRQQILENLIDEERGASNHPALWRRFASAVGADEQFLRDSAALPTTQALVKTFRGICGERPFFAGLAALYAFESQVPQIAKVKIDGLQRFYGMEHANDYAFFSVHQQADVHHSQAEWNIIEQCATSPADQALVEKSVIEARDALWQFLDGVAETFCADVCVCATEASSPLVA